MRRNPLLLTDFYKTIHHLAYVPGMDYLVSYWTPRMTRIEGVEKVVMFGMQGYTKETLIDMFNECFFNRPFEEVEAEYIRVIANTMTIQAADTKHLKKLHTLGYLPVEISAVSEGEEVDIKTPMFQIRNTVSGYGWLVNYLETLTSTNVWHAMTTATIGRKYRHLVNAMFDKTVSEKAVKHVEGGTGKVTDLNINNTVKLNAVKSAACGDFSMRGMTSVETSAKGSAGHLLSFTGTATIPAILWLEDYYNCNCEKEVVGKGVPSTEHSVMSSYGRDGEFECYRHLIEDVFKTGPLSIVSDTYDYWNVLTNFLPKLKKSIMGRDGKIIIRGDSGDPVDIVCGEFNEMVEEVVGLTTKDIKKYYSKKAIDLSNLYNCKDNFTFFTRVEGKVYKVVVDMDMDEETNYECTTGEISDISVELLNLTPAQKGTIEILWEIFGGYINEKGYKVLDSHIGAIYGDGITPERAKAIYERLERKGFAVNNCTLGIGSFTYQYNTRDSLGFALKSTNSIVDGVERQIYKDPATDKDNFKKSQRGMCYVHRDGDKVVYEDGYTFESIKENTDNMLQPVFRDSKLIREFSLQEIRNTLNKGSF